MKKTSILLLLLLGIVALQGRVKAVWAPGWDITTPQAIDTMVENCASAGINEILAQVRYRGDALYVPNKHNSRYPNPEPRSHLLKDATFDPLEYLLAKAKKRNIRVQAWVTVFIISPHETDKLAPTHPFFLHSQWISADFQGKPMQQSDHEGAFFDPGIAAVRNYVHNVIMDIAMNYPVDGIHLDYIRYPDMAYGFNPLARQEFAASTPEQDAESWMQWREGTITNFILSLKQDLASHHKKMALTAAVIEDREKGRQKYSQNWAEWLKDGVVDRVYLMAYTQDTGKIETELKELASLKKNKKIVVGLRGWNDDSSYRARQIQDKMALVKRRGMSGFALFSYGGLINAGYLSQLKTAIKRY